MIEIEEVYFSLLKALNIKLECKSDNLFKIDENLVPSLIGKERYLELKRLFDLKLSQKYYKPISELKLLHPVEIAGICKYGFYFENVKMQDHDLHYIYAKDKEKLVVLTKANESLLKCRIPYIVEYDQFFEDLLINNKIHEEDSLDDFVFLKSDVKKEELLRVESVRSVYKDYCYYVAVLETSEDDIKGIYPIQNLINLQ